MSYGPQIVPPGGFVFSSGNEHVEAFDRDGLISGLTNLRIARGEDIGTPDLDVDRQLSARSPTYHSPNLSGAIMSEEARHEKRSLLNRVRAFCKSLKVGRIDRSSIKYVPKQEANRRALICVTCVKNVNWRSACAPCVQKIETDIVLLSRNFKTRVDDKLHACQCLGQSNQIAVWLDDSHLDLKSEAFSKVGKLPKRCWLNER